MALSVPLRVCAAVRVMKSVLVRPLAALSMLRASVLTLVVGAVVSSTKSWLKTGPSLPAVSETLTLRVLLAPRVTPGKLQLVLPALAVAAVQVTPLSRETQTLSPAPSALPRLPLTVWAAVLVIRSVLLVPLAAVSALNWALATVVAGALVSSW